jgi:Zn-dependent M32 family carboxypeptidase
MYATQIFQKATSEIPDLESKIAAGEFAPLKAWLNARIHAAGSLHASGDELMVAATGSALDPSIFLTCVPPSSPLHRRRRRCCVVAAARPRAPMTL